MKWRIVYQEELKEGSGFVITIAEFYGSGDPSGALITVPCSRQWDEERVSEDKAIENIFRSLFLRVRNYLGCEPVRLSVN